MTFNRTVIDLLNYPLIATAHHTPIIKNVLLIVPYCVSFMVLISDGNTENGAHVRSNLG